MTTDLYFVPFITHSADKIIIVVEAHSAQEATALAQLEALDIGALDEDEVGDPDAECYFLEPEKISPAQGISGVRLRIS